MPGLNNLKTKYMVITRYKPFFSVSVSYELAATGISGDGVKVVVIPMSNDLMNGLRLRSKAEKNTVTVFYEGIETPPDVPVRSEPLLTIDTEEYFYFKVNLSDKEKIKGLKF